MFPLAEVNYDAVSAFTVLPFLHTVAALELLWLSVKEV
jgi:hypothetical protein